MNEQPRDTVVCGISYCSLGRLMCNVLLNSEIFMYELHNNVAICSTDIGHMLTYQTKIYKGVDIADIKEADRLIFAKAFFQRLYTTGEHVKTVVVL